MMSRSRILLLAAMVSGCRLTTDPIPDLVVSIAAAPAVITPTTPAEITVTAANHGSRSLTINVNGCPAPFLVSTAAGDAVALTPQLCNLSLRNKTLVPGEEYTFRASWDGTRSGGAYGATPILVAPGDYRLVGAVFAGSGVVRSAPVQIRVSAR
jgi:hypothetical protein